ncbi:MAG: translation initiation factor IF-2 [Tenericutes bacterium HGW-Tenericutes-4]|nr:MAG: translation initiation factor IF-2 [Tenericutes bacterium HGW-Tenericutes-4]
MEVKNLNYEEKNNQPESSIESLKKLSQLVSGEHFSHLQKEIQSAKRSLESLYQTVSDKRRKLIGIKEVNEAQKAIATTTLNEVVVETRKENLSSIIPPQSVEQVPVVAESSFKKETSFQKTENPSYQNRTPNPNYQGNPNPNYKGTTPNPNYQRPPYNNQGGFNRPQNAPFDKDAANRPFNKPKPYSSGSAPVVEEVIAVEVRNKFAQNNLNKKPSSSDYDKKAKSLTKKQLIKRNFITGETNSEDRILTRKPKKKNKEQVIAAPKIIEHAVITTENLTVKVLAESIGKPVTDIVKKMFLLGVVGTINSVIDFETAELVANELGITLEKNVQKTYEEKLSILIENSEDDKKNLKPRAPIVTVMGHVDHGKTSLLDAIRQTNVISGEAGGITQNIGAYMVRTEKGKITFIDTPGHAAFTEMRARGAKVTDIAVLVVAADDGIMPQTIEAINHIKAAEVPMVVAINKIDKPHANIEKTKQQLAEHNVLAEDWGGDTIMVPVSAHTKEGIDKLLDMILLVAEVKELKANPSSHGLGTIIEARLDKGRGPIATLIVANGVFKVGDAIVAGVASGRIRAMIDDQGKEIKKALPSMPVAIVGFDTVPETGSIANVVNEKMMKELVFERENKQKESRQTSGKAINLEDLFNKAKLGNQKTLNVIIKANVSGVMEALKQSLEKIKNDEVSVRCVHGAAGAINENDVLLAQTTNSIIIGFNVKPDANAKRLIDKEGVDVRFYDIIYNAINDVEAAVKGMLTPKYEEVIIGHAEVRVLYKISKIGTIAGCVVKDGRITKNAKVRVMRNNKLLVDTNIETLRILKDDVKEVRSGFEFGIKVPNFNDFLEGDIIEAYVQELIKN